MSRPVTYVVSSDTWIGPPNVQKSVLVRKGTVMSIAPDNAAMIAMYSGSSNLAALTPGHIADPVSSDHSWQANQEITMAPGSCSRSAAGTSPDNEFANAR